MKKNDSHSQEKIVWFNGNFQNLDQVNISLLTHGLHYGTSIFEGIRIYDGQIFKAKEHFDRFIKSGNATKINIKYSSDELVKITEELVYLNNLKEGYIRPVAWLSSGSLIIDAPQNNVNIAIACWQRINEFYRNIENKKPISLGFSKYRKYPDSGLHNVKAGGMYILNYLIKTEAKEQGYDDALVFDHEDNICEAATSNIFFIKGNKIHTPETGLFLNGITRQTIIDIANNNNIKLIERKIHKNEISSFDDAFLTGTACEIVKVKNILNYNYQFSNLTIKIAELFYDSIKSINYCY